MSIGRILIIIGVVVVILAVAFAAIGFFAFNLFRENVSEGISMAVTNIQEVANPTTSSGVSPMTLAIDGVA
jgi:flagellar basal body-associated protein FliL